MSESDLGPKPMSPRQVRRIIRQEAQKGYSWRKRIRSHFREFSDVYLNCAIYAITIGLLAYTTTQAHAYVVHTACDGFVPGLEDDFCLDTRTWNTLYGALSWIMSIGGGMASTSIIMLILVVVFKTIFGPVLSEFIAYEMEEFTIFFGRCAAFCAFACTITYIAPYFF